MPKHSRASRDESESEEGHSAGRGAPDRPLKKNKTGVERKAQKKKQREESEGGESIEEENTSRGNIAKNVLTNDEGDKYVTLGAKRRLTVRSFKGKALVDIREFYGEPGDEKPGKKGISLSAEQWEDLKSNVSAVDELLRRLK